MICTKSSNMSVIESCLLISNYCIIHKWVSVLLKIKNIYILCKWNEIKTPKTHKSYNSRPKRMPIVARSWSKIFNHPFALSTASTFYGFTIEIKHDQQNVVNIKQYRSQVNEWEWGKRLKLYHAVLSVYLLRSVIQVYIVHKNMHILCYITPTQIILKLICFYRRQWFCFWLFSRSELLSRSNIIFCLNLQRTVFNSRERT